MDKKTLVFPQDFNAIPHNVVLGGIQWRPIIDQKQFISIVGVLIGK